MSGGEHTEAERLRSAEVTLATIADLAGQVDKKAMRDVLAVLGARWLPEGAPVALEAQP